MSQAQTLVDEVKRALRENGQTYRDVATHLSLSEASIKRLFANGQFSLDRFDKLLDLIGIDFSELMERVNRRREFLSELTVEQEKALVTDPDFFVVTFLVLNRWSFRQIVDEYRFSERQVESALLRLNRLKVIELLPQNRYRLLTTRNFSWRKNGSVSRFFREQVLPEFYASEFRAAGEELRFVGGMLSADSIAEMQDGVGKLARRFAELAEQDAGLPLNEKIGTSAVLAFRPIEYSMFTERRRTGRVSARLDLDPK
ncbi:MAG: helix-turn-helix domain-containing protein [Pseudomonadota bacterium]